MEPRTRWEYCMMPIGQAELEFLTLDGSKYETAYLATKGRRRDKEAKKIAELGLDGWEMSCCGPGWIYFKRPVS